MTVEYVVAGPDDAPVLASLRWASPAHSSAPPRSREDYAGDLQSVYVTPEHRGAKIGAGLVEALVSQARARGLSQVTVLSGRHALPLYRRLGFASSEMLLRLDL